MITEEDFIEMTGYKPRQDDLERCNCKRAGQVGHFSCGVCKEHNVPVFMCSNCFGKHPNQIERRELDDIQPTDPETTG